MEGSRKRAEPADDGGDYCKDNRTLTVVGDGVQILGGDKHVQTL